VHDVKGIAGLPHCKALPNARQVPPPHKTYGAAPPLQHIGIFESLPPNELVPLLSDFVFAGDVPGVQRPPEPGELLRYGPRTVAHRPVVRANRPPRSSAIARYPFMGIPCHNARASEMRLTRFSRRDCDCGADSWPFPAPPPEYKATAIAASPPGPAVAGCGPDAAVTCKIRTSGRNASSAP